MSESSDEILHMASGALLGAWIGFMICLVVVRRNISVHKEHCLSDMIVSKLQPGRVYKIVQRQDGAWDIRKTDEFYVALSCSIAKP